jgi:hypothetical protein
MDDELDSVTNSYPNLEQPTTEAGADQHRQAVEVEDSDGVSVGVEHVFVWDPVLSSARKNHGIHCIKLP